VSENFDQELFQDFTQTSEALRPIAEDETTFRLLVQSFRAQDHEGFRDLLARFQLLDRCDLICHWLCAKHCALVCFELCGPPPRDPPKLELREFGELIRKIAADQETLERLAGSVIERDELAFRAIVEKLGVERYCHYICHWICSIRCRLVCEILCSQEKPVYIVGCVHLLPALQQAAAAITRLLADRQTFAAVEKGVLARDCNVIRVALERKGFQGVCRWICHWLCVWRCVRVCVTLCRPFPVDQIDDTLPEIHDFSLALI
jgi:hypothetical protein